MSVIVELSVPGEDFGLGQVLDVVSGIAIELESMVPMGERAIPFFWIHNSHRETFTTNLADQEFIKDLTDIETLNGKTLYALEWNGETDKLFEGIQQRGPKS